MLQMYKQWSIQKLFLDGHHGAFHCFICSNSFQSITFSKRLQNVWKITAYVFYYMNCQLVNSMLCTTFSVCWICPVLKLLFIKVYEIYFVQVKHIVEIWKRLFKKSYLGNCGSALLGACHLTGYRQAASRCLIRAAILGSSVYMGRQQLVRYVQCGAPARGHCKGLLRVGRDNGPSEALCVWGKGTK